MSFMDRKNILSEGFFDSLKNLFKRSNFTKKELKLMRKSPKFRKAMLDFETQHKKVMDMIDKAQETDFAKW